MTSRNPVHRKPKLSRQRPRVVAYLALVTALAGTASASAGSWPANWPDKGDPTWKSMEAAHKEWTESFFAAMTTSDDPAVRIAAIVQQSHTGRLAGEAVDSDKALQGLASAANDPASGPNEIWGAIGTCFTIARTGDALDECIDGVDIDRLDLLEPGNAALDLVRITANIYASGGEDVDTKANRELLARAARGDDFNLHWGGLALPVAQAAIRFHRSHPVERTWDIPGTDDLYLESVMWTSAFLIDAHYYQVRELCQAQVDNDRSSGIEDCRTLGTLMETRSRTALARNIGQNLRTSADGITEDSPEGIREQQRRYANMWQIMCQSPAWITDPFQMRKHFGLATAERTLAFAKARTRYGEIEGSRRLALTDYAENPQDYVLAPESCERFGSLDDATLDLLAADGPVHSITQGVARLVELGEVDAGDLSAVSP